MFRFKRFSVDDSRSAMKVGTDGVLLGAWFSPCGGRILDIGTGSGLIALMAAQRTQAAIDAIDIDKGSADDAAANFSDSEWSDRLKAQHASLSEWIERSVGVTYDAIVSNPPYFVDSLLPPGKERSAARHTSSLPFAELAGGVASLLKKGGRFSLILPPEEFASFVVEAEKHLLQPARIAHVSSFTDSPVIRVMAEFIFGDTTPSIERIAIRTEHGGDFSCEYKSLTSAFYLKF